MDVASIVLAVIGSAGLAGIVTGIQDWLGIGGSVRRLQALVELRKSLTGRDAAANDALTLTIRELSLRAAARTTERHTFYSALWLFGLFLVAFLFGPVVFPPEKADPAWLVSARSTVTGVAAALGGYATLEFTVRCHRVARVREWKEKDNFESGAPEARAARDETAATQSAEPSKTTEEP